MAAITELQVLARLQEQLEERDEIIVALQHAIGDLRHEIETLRSDRAYAAAHARSSGRIRPV
jgi:cell division protein FtsB